MALRDRLLGTKSGYSLFRKVINADKSMRLIARDYVRAADGQTIADLGCGTGDLAAMLPSSVRYIGVDHNSAYLTPSDISSAAGGRHFVNADLSNLASANLPPIDTAVAIGVLHHLTDDEVRAMLHSVRDLLVEGGRVVTVDPVFEPSQRSSARIMMAMDRGRYVRHPEHYQFIFREVFPGAVSDVRSDFLPFPYTHCIFQATKSR